MGIDLVLFGTTPTHRGHGSMVFVTAIRPEPEAGRKVLSCRAIQHGRMISNFEADPPPYSRRGRLRQLILVIDDLLNGLGELRAVPPAGIFSALVERAAVGPLDLAG